MSSIRVALCQLNAVVGDLDGNVARMIEALDHASEGGADLAVFPELTVTGYPPEDLLLKARFVQQNLEALERFAAVTSDCVAVVGFVDCDLDLFNAAAVCHKGKVVGRYHKRVLPNYSVFDEKRYFAAGGPATTLYEIAGINVGISICEDVWSPDGPIAEQAAAGAELMININASPYYAKRLEARQRMLSVRAADTSVPIVYVNQVGGQDELVFDGASFVVDEEGDILASAGQFIEEVMFVDLEVRPGYRKRLLDPRGRETVTPLPVLRLTERPERRKHDVSAHPHNTPLDVCAEIYSALVLGTRDYVRKNGFTDVVIGLSGGVDSSIVATVAVDALGSSHVHGVSMPSRYSSEGSKADAYALAENLGIDIRTIPIEPAHDAMQAMLKQSVDGELVGLSDENLQSRLRGVTLMALSNEFGWLVLTTGNKSELAVGYSTLYGDTAGGFAVIKDVAKTRVYELCRWRNLQGTAVIPESVLVKPPSAELRPDQTDQDSLPPYEVLDPILLAYVEDDRTASEIEALGFDSDIVRRVVRLVDIAEYKRRQSPIGVRVTPKAFGRDRRVPITNHYTG